MWRVSQAESNLKQYGKILMAEAPEQTTKLLKHLCTDYKPTNREHVFFLSLTVVTPAPLPTITLLI